MSGTTRLDRFTPTSGQRATGASLRDALRAPAAAPALLLVTGEPGSGKSAMLAELHDRVDHDPGLAAGATIDAADAHSDGRLLRAIFAAFDETPSGRSGIELLTTLRAFFVARADDGRRPALFIDGAEALTGSQLEIVRSLLTPVAGEDVPVTIHPVVTLVGRPELRERIRRRRPLAQRRALDLQLAPPNPDDIARLIDGTTVQAAALIATAERHGVAPLALAARVIPRLDGAPPDDAILETITRTLPPAAPVTRPVAEAVQTAMPFRPAPTNRTDGALQLSLLGHASIETGGGDR